jgi:hypothetical protein
MNMKYVIHLDLLSPTVSLRLSSAAFPQTTVGLLL